MNQLPPIVPIVRSESAVTTDPTHDSNTVIEPAWKMIAAMSLLVVAYIVAVLAFA